MSDNINDPRSFAEHWISESLGVTELAEADRRSVVDGIRRLYRSAGVPWPNHVIWAQSPAELASLADRSSVLIREWLHDPERRAEYEAARRRRAIRGRRKLLSGLAAYGGCLLLGALVTAIGRHYGIETEDSYGVRFYPLDFGFYLAAIVFGPIAIFFAALMSFRQPDDRNDMEYEQVVPMYPRGLDSDDRPIGSEADRRIAEAADRIDRNVAETSPEVDLLAGLPPARRAAAWIAYRSLTIICAPPRTLCIERVGEAYRVHNDTGPAVVWGEGSSDHHYYLHGVRIPARLYLGLDGIESLHAQANVEVRRELIERMGWLQYVEQADLRLVATALDPADNTSELRLYDLPRQHYRRARVLITVTRPGDDRSRVYGDVVPARTADPVAAAGWLYGVSADDYRRFAPAVHGEPLIVPAQPPAEPVVHEKRQKPLVATKLAGPENLEASEAPQIAPSGNS